MISCCPLARVGVVVAAVIAFVVVLFSMGTFGSSLTYSRLSTYFRTYVAVQQISLRLSTRFRLRLYVDLFVVVNPTMAKTPSE